MRVGVNQVDFYKAIELMKNGKQVQSLLSKTLYEVNGDDLLVEGRAAPTGYYITVQEAFGYWREVSGVETSEGSLKKALRS